MILCLCLGWLLVLVLVRVFTVYFSLVFGVCYFSGLLCVWCVCCVVRFLVLAASGCFGGSFDLAFALRLWVLCFLWVGVI